MTTGTGPEADAFLASWQEWRAARLAQLREPYGILSPVALHWLDVKAQRFDDVPGSWQADDSGVRVRAARGEGLRIDGALVDGDRTVRQGGVVPPHGGAVQVAGGDLRIDVLGFEDADRPRRLRWAIRVRSPRAPTLLRFTDVPVHPPRPEWVTRAVYEPYKHPRRIVLDTALDTVRREFTLSGRLRFTLAGRELTLEPYGGRDGVLNIPFRDLTSGATSYGAARVLYACRPAGDVLDGRSVVLDFNRAINPPCAFTPFATCALPPTGNTLPIAVEAGELAPYR
ncbi:DUF1684 domain-containing protein [Streptomyces sp. VRA16 Mangrove soil]|uniref:DUF1684 domain-containing protein n=1 Tax=Streptomyces sp. VRA16 Mangrove soil TaxID=2817434 RepID=UPI001A9D58D4|nr:DUF1684 domain-containing protein [Streptomyces sp. VRA16 Mangrove soil]MBO1332650.1 DUF1684 domain-containing protein [Streptomyces sp. VRA16 Mangrove soil]